MRYFASIFLASLLAASTFVIPTQAQATLSMNSTVSQTDELGPFNLAYLAYQGYLKDQKIPSGGALINAIGSGKITAQDVIQAAVKDDRLPESKLQDKSYHRHLKAHLMTLIQD